MKRVASSPFWLFLLLTLIATWPLAAASTRSLASDYGDPLFTTWAMGWVSAHLTSMLRGDLSAFTSYWNANIFFPEPNTLAFSDHMFTEAVQTLPLYWATGNLLLCYNASLILSFALSGYGTYLLVADLTASAAGAIAAGVFFAFCEYRLSYEISHLQSLSIQFLPFALFGLHRFIARDSRAALGGAVAALVLLNLAAGFHMLYCAPFVAGFVLFDLAQHGRVRDGRAWISLAIAAGMVSAATVPFAWRYVLMQRQLHFERQLDEVIRFSATLDQYRAALPGFAVPLTLSAVAIVTALGPRFGGRRESAPIERAQNSGPSTSALTGAATVGLLLTFWLSLGPVVRGGAHALPVPGLYALLYDYIPGFRGVRAVARYAMLFFFFLGVLGGFGIAAIEARSRRAAYVLTLVACTLFLWQTRVSPFPLDREWPAVSAGLARVPPYLRPQPTVPAVYRFVAALNRDAVLAEFPFGDNAYDLRYMYFSTMHQRRLLGGFSGVFPDSWAARRDLLARPLASPEAAWHALDGATHAIVHADGWPDATGEQIAGWLRSHGARDAGVFDAAHVFEIHARDQR